jgi:uncharacterized membrane protein
VPNWLERQAQEQEQSNHTKEQSVTYFEILQSIYHGELLLLAVVVVVVVVVVVACVVVVVVACVVVVVVVVVSSFVSGSDDKHIREGI